MKQKAYLDCEDNSMMAACIAYVDKQGHTFSIVLSGELCVC